MQRSAKKRMDKLRLALVGLGGMGKTHLKVIRQLADEGKVELVAVCNRNSDRFSESLSKFGFESAHRYEDYDVFINSGEKLDLVVISTPIPLHKIMSCKALTAGYNVLLEKPPAVTIQDIDEMR